MEWVKLGDVASYINGYSFKPSDWHGTGLPIIRIQNLTNPSAEYNYTNLKVDDKYHVNRGDILISWSATLDVFEWEDEPAYLNQHIFKVVFDKIDINKDFFKYAVKYLLVKSSKNAHGSTMKHLTRKNFEKIKFPKYPIEKQEEVANILNQVRILIQTRQDQIQALDDLVESIFDELLNKNDVKLTALDDLITKKPDRLSNKNTEPISYFDISSIDNISHKIIEEKNILNSKERPSRAKQLIMEDDVIVSTVRPNLKNVAYFDYKNTYIPIASTGFAVLRSNKSIINPKYLFHIVLTDYFTNILMSVATGANYPAVKERDIRNIKVPIIDIEKQNHFAAFVEKIEKQKQILNNSLGDLTNLFDSLMQDAFDGSMTK